MKFLSAGAIFYLPTIVVVNASVNDPEIGANATKLNINSCEEYVNSSEWSPESCENHYDTYYGNYYRVQNGMEAIFGEEGPFKFSVESKVDSATDSSQFELQNILYNIHIGNTLQNISIDFNTKSNKNINIVAQGMRDLLSLLPSNFISNIQDVALFVLNGANDPAVNFEYSEKKNGEMLKQNFVASVDTSGIIKVESITSVIKEEGLFNKITNAISTFIDLIKNLFR
jgi:hypothetical protein